MKDPRPPRTRTAMAIYVTFLMLLSAVPLAAPPMASAADPELDGVIGAGEYEHSMVFDTDQFYVHWTINGDRIYFGLRAATTGYLALGFAPTDELEDLDIVYGRVTAGPTVDVRDTWSSTKTGPAVNDTTITGTMDIENEDGSEVLGYTTIEFRRDRDTGDAYDYIIPATGAMKVTWMIGMGDAWDAGVSKMDEGKLELGTTPPPPPSGALDGVVTTGEYGDNHTTFDTGRFELYWRIVGSDIYIALRAQATGWVSLGFEPSNQMLDADMLFGWVDASAVPWVVDAYSTGVTGPHPEDASLGGTYDITDYNCTETAGWTTVEILRPLVTGDTYDQDIQSNHTHNIIWAVADVDDFGAKHTRVGYGTWRISDTPPPPPPPPSDRFDGIISGGEYANNTTFDTDRFELHWTVNGTEILLGIRAQATGTVALGIDPELRMKGADMLIGWVDGTGPHLEDAYSIGETGPHPADIDQGGTFDIPAFNGTEAAGWTTIEFARNLTTGDGHDKPIPESGTVTILWAVSDTDDFLAEHTRRGSGIWRIAGDVPPPPPPPANELDGVITEGEYGNNTTFDGGLFELNWRIANNTTLYAAIRARTTGWVSLGIDPEFRMQGADMLFGGFDGATAYAEDAYSTGPTGPHPRDADIGGTFDLLAYNATEEDGWTTFELKRNLTTLDTAYDKPIPENGSVTIMWAVGPSDDWNAEHLRRGAGTWDVVPPPPPPPPPGSELDGIITEGEYANVTLYDDDRFELHWRVDEANGTIYIGLRADTLGWIALGLDPSLAMNQSDMLFGAVKDGVPIVMDAWSIGVQGPHPADTTLGGTDDILAYNATEDGNWTSVEIKRNHTATDQYDKTIPIDGNTTVMWAVGGDDDLISEHIRRGGGHWVLAGPPPPPPPSSSWPSRARPPVSSPSGSNRQSS